MKSHECQICCLRFASAAAAKRHRSKKRCKHPEPKRSPVRHPNSFGPMMGLSVGMALALAAMGAVTPHLTRKASHD